MNQKPILLRGASAGSGKTHFLAKTYIRLLLERYFHPEHPKDVYQYRHVLAVTFTNKATAEMKERILRELDILSHTPSQSGYYKEFVQYFSCTDEALKTASGEILFHLLHEYGAFSVSTIDSFFQLVLRAFSREIGYYSSYQVELDRGALIGECVDRILDALDEGKENEELLQWLTRKAVFRVANGEKFSSDALLLEVAGQLMTDHYKDALKKSRMNEDALYDHTRLIRLEETCRKRRREYLAAVKAAAQAAQAEAESALGGIRTSRDVLEKALGKLAAIQEKSNKEGIPGLSDAAYAKLLEPAGAVNTDAWFKKADLPRFADGNGLKGLLDKMEHLRRAYDEGTKMVATLDIIIPQLYGFGVVRRIRQELAALMKEKNVLSLDETNEILKDLIADTATPFIYEKVGVRYENFLLDEFQDTSHVQWDNFRPLLQESVDNGHTDLVVGDPKQSIYRWRNSDAALMTKALPEAFGQYIDDTHELDTNWRSAEEIVRFNNAFFAFSAQRMDASLGQGRVLQEIYRDVCQKPNHRKGGYVRLDFCEGRETEEGKAKSREEEMEKVLESINEAVSHGFRYGDITIVVRKGSQGISLAACLTEKGIKVSTSDTLGIASSSIVRLLISLLSNRDDPNDRARAYLAGHFLSGETQEAGDCSLVDICEGLLRDIKAKRPDEFNAQIPYIRCFMDVLNDFVARGDNSLHSFVRYVSQRDDTISAPEAQDAVNIITIHKVKGLAAPYIIVPFV
ncbi:MAG: UvrD-helicase domain-containing protein, partial [Bacteroidales bacterium]|nr:UvrD-helicase domain-containing protein [Bacteroidales bacterium]